MVRNTHVPPQFHAALDEALTPTRADVLAAKQLVLDTLAARGAVTTDALEAAVREREGVPALTHGETLDLQADADPAPLARRDVPQLARVRIARAVRRALAELAASGVVLPVRNPDGEVSIHNVRSGNTTGGYYAPDVVEEVASSYALTSPPALGGTALLDTDLYTADIAGLLGERGVRCVDEALRAHRRGMHLAAVNMLGSASEAAWYALGERLRGRSAQLARKLDEDTATAAVIRLVHETLVQQKLGGVRREALEELRSHATYLRDLRNYGLHPRGRVSADLEHHFTEHAAALTFMTSHRYFIRLAEIAAHLPAGDAQPLES
ncbi:hypothetical protein SAMN05660748_1079 [Blastococcus aggregatus]|uniref:Uncharacterized protein n=1 Tax=Blastococcus aggregatus TaxID=38502 RepID=A0A285V5S0_9ACTN|nr:hypothetical protein [Blastococcus aggregatus]SOC47851.1 hypothetical protein SAMN05660748_1079 [Blastococcus aggregatus]